MPHGYHAGRSGWLLYGREGWISSVWLNIQTKLGACTSNLIVAARCVEDYPGHSSGGVADAARATRHSA